MRGAKSWIAQVKHVSNPTSEKHWVKNVASILMGVGLLGIAYGLRSFHYGHENKNPEMYPSADADARGFIVAQRFISGTGGGIVVLAIGAYLRGFGKRG